MHGGERELKQGPTSKARQARRTKREAGKRPEAATTREAQQEGTASKETTEEDTPNRAKRETGKRPVASTTREAKQEGTASKETRAEQRAEAYNIYLSIK